MLSHLRQQPNTTFAALACPSASNLRSLMVPIDCISVLPDLPRLHTLDMTVMKDYRGEPLDLAVFVLAKFPSLRALHLRGRILWNNGHFTPFGSFCVSGFHFNRREAHQVPQELK
jgi:hypothetical protein